MNRKTKIPVRFTEKLAIIAVNYISCISHMLETPHVAVGAVIATIIPNPFLAIPLSFASHFILEKVPHWNPHLNTETKKYGRPTNKSIAIASADSMIALFLGLSLAERASGNPIMAFTILGSCFAAVLPDLIEAPYFFLKNRSKYLIKWVEFQKSIQSDTTPFWGLMTQVITLAVTLLFLYTPRF